jgi:hypothetical protein
MIGYKPINDIIQNKFVYFINMIFINEVRNNIKFR